MCFIFSSTFSINKVSRNCRQRSLNFALVVRGWWFWLISSFTQLFVNHDSGANRTKMGLWSNFSAAEIMFKIWVTGWLHIYTSKWFSVHTTKTLAGQINWKIKQYTLSTWRHISSVKQFGSQIFCFSIKNHFVSFLTGFHLGSMGDRLGDLRY